MAAIISQRKYQLAAEKSAAGDYVEAVKLMTEAVDLCPKQPKFRGYLAYYLQKNLQFEEAKQEALVVITELNSSYLMAYQVYFGSCLVTGDLSGMRDALQKMRVCPGRVTKTRCNIQDCEEQYKTYKDLAQRAVDLSKLRDHIGVLALCEELFKIAPHSNPTVCKKGIAFMGLEKYANAVETFKLIPKYEEDYRVLRIMAKAEFMSGKFPAAIELNERALKLLDQSNPDYRTLIKFRKFLHHISEEIRGTVMANRNQDWPMMELRAVRGQHLLSKGSFYNDRLRLQMMNFEAEALLKQGKYEEAFVLATEVLNDWESSFDATLIVADVEVHVGKYQDALLRLEKLRSLKRRTQRSRLELLIVEAAGKEEEFRIATAETPESLDVYGMLELPPFASEEEVRAAYKRLSLLLHPDKNMHLTGQEALDMRTRYQNVKTSYNILSNPSKKQIFDDQLRHREACLKEKQAVIENLNEKRRLYPKVFGSLAEAPPVEKTGLLRSHNNNSDSAVKERGGKAKRFKSDQ